MVDVIDAAGIFTGRGGSGTRLLSEIAAASRIFIGNEVNKSGDSVEWIDLIYRMVAEAGGQRELPTGAQYRREIRAKAEEVLSHTVLGCSRSWGLKLPEAMLVLPLLIDAFPHAKVVHLIRHPVSSSLRRTHMTSRLHNPVGDVALPAAYRYAGRAVRHIETDEPHLHNAYAWNFQVTRVVQFGREVLGPSRYLEVRYEDVCAQPDRMLEILHAYLGCGGDRGGASIAVDLSRAGVWDPRDPRSGAIWEICGESAERLGYALDAPRQGAST